MSCRATLTTNRSSSAITLPRPSGQHDPWMAVLRLNRRGSVTADGNLSRRAYLSGSEGRDRTGFALLVEEPGVSKKAAAADGELNWPASTRSTMFAVEPGRFGH